MNFRKILRFLTKFTIIFSVFSFLCVYESWAQTRSPALRQRLGEIYEELQTRVKDKGEIYIDVVSLPEGGPVFSQNNEQAVSIASLQKLYLTYAALNILGGEYKFPTEFYVDYDLKDRGRLFDSAGGIIKKEEIPKDTFGNLYIRGYGDPSFLHENIFQIIRELKGRGLDSINDIVVDDTLFLDPEGPTGSSPYTAGQSATSIEFNTYRVDVKAGVPGEKPVLSLSPGVLSKIDNKAKSFQKGGTSLEINQNPDNTILVGKSFQSAVINPELFNISIQGRIDWGQDYFQQYLAHPYPSVYFGSSFLELLKSSGIKIKGGLRLGQVPESAKSIYIYESKPLYEILSDLNHYSSNFIAGQLLFAIGQDESGRLSKMVGLKNMLDQVEKIKNFPKGAVFKDGSGLSKDNSSTLKQLISLLVHVHSDPLIGPNFFSSLSRYGVSGTLKKRSLMGSTAQVWTSIYEEEKRKVESVWGKTGTIDGISAVAGVAPGESDVSYAFAILIKGNIPKEEAIILEDTFVSTITGVNRKSK